MENKPGIKSKLVLPLAFVAGLFATSTASAQKPAQAPPIEYKKTTLRYPAVELQPAAETMMLQIMKKINSARTKHLSRSGKLVAAAQHEQIWIKNAENNIVLQFGLPGNDESVSLNTLYMTITPVNGTGTQYMCMFDMDVGGIAILSQQIKNSLVASAVHVTIAQINPNPGEITVKGISAEIKSQGLFDGMTKYQDYIRLTLGKNTNHTSVNTLQLTQDFNLLALSVLSALNE